MRSLGTARIFAVGIADNHALAIFPCADSTMTLWIVLRDSMTFLDSSERTFSSNEVLKVDERVTLNQVLSWSEPLQLAPGKCHVIQGTWVNGMVHL